MANRLFLALPTEAALSQLSKDDLLALANQLIDALNMIDHEDYKGYFDKDNLRHFYQFATAIDRNLGVMLLAAIEPWLDYRSQANAKSNRNYVANGVSAAGSLLASYLDNITGSLFLTLKPAKSKPSPVSVTENNHLLFKIIPAVIEEKFLYSWFVSNRLPQRQLDKDYKKHSKFREHMGKKGDVISPWTYADAEAVKLLRHAVYSKSAKRLILHHKKDKKILVFFNENLAEPTYHAYQIYEKDSSELSKFSNASIKKMKKISY